MGTRMKMFNVQILLSLSIGVLSLSSVSSQNFSSATNVTANCSSSCGDCTIIECVSSGKYEELSVNEISIGNSTVYCGIWD